MGETLRWQFRIRIYTIKFFITIFQARQDDGGGADRGGPGTGCLSHPQDCYQPLRVLQHR